MKRLIVVLVIVLILLPLFLKPSNTIDIKIGDTSIKALVADSSRERNMGLSGKKELLAGEGMLFIFDIPDKYGFWMKDMNFAIDIIWIDENMRVVGIEREVKPESYPDVFNPPSRVKYVLEVPAMFSDTAKIEVGEILSIGQ